MEYPDERKNLERFGEIVLAEPALHHQLRVAATKEEFITLAIRLGAEFDCEFSAATVESALRAQYRAWLERWV